MARYNIVVAVLVLGVVGARGSSEAMRHIATGFIRVLDECKQEVSNEFYFVRLFRHD